MEDTHPAVRGTFRRWDKDGHLSRIRDSGWFPFSRELVFAHTEDGSADRLLALALSQGGVQALIRTAPQAVLPSAGGVRESGAGRSGRSAPAPMTFSYRLRLGIRRTRQPPHKKSPVVPALERSAGGRGLLMGGLVSCPEEAVRNRGQ